MATEKNKSCPVCGEATSFGIHTNCRRMQREEEESRMLSRYPEAIALIEDLIGWAEESGCDCGQDDPPCTLCRGKAFLAAEPAERGEGGA